jgi:hypothetical protein
MERAIQLKPGQVVKDINEKEYEIEEGDRLFESNEVEREVQKYVEEIQEYHNEYYKKNFPGSTLDPSKYSYLTLQKYYKIIYTTLGGSGQTSVFCFVDKETGDIYMAAGWKVPAKGARGNLFTGKRPLDARDLYKRL